MINKVPNTSLLRVKDIIIFYRQMQQFSPGADFKISPCLPPVNDAAPCPQGRAGRRQPTPPPPHEDTGADSSPGDRFGASSRLLLSDTFPGFAWEYMDNVKTCSALAPAAAAGSYVQPWVMLHSRGQAHGTLVLNPGAIHPHHLSAMATDRQTAVRISRP